MFSYHVFDSNFLVPPYTWQESTLLLQSIAGARAVADRVILNRAQSVTYAWIVLEPPAQRLLQTGLKKGVLKLVGLFCQKPTVAFY